jgi:hypothetical protein
MKGIPILIVFFTIFLAASLLIPSPMFPGNLLSNLFSNLSSAYKGWVSAFLNAVFYGIILWLIFVAVSRRFEEK